eukprot:gene5379-34199_t
MSVCNAYPPRNGKCPTEGWPKLPVKDCTPDGTINFFKAPMPANYTWPNDGGNDGAAFLLADRRTVQQCQPFHRCSLDGPATCGTGPPLAFPSSGGGTPSGMRPEDGCVG